MTDATSLAVANYYCRPSVRARLMEYCGAINAESPSAAFIVGLNPEARPFPIWSTCAHVPCSDLAALCDRGWDVSRSLWDSRALILLIDLDYQNLDCPAEPFTHATDVFFKLESTYEAVRTTLRQFGIAPLILATGRGYHFVGRIPLDEAVVDGLASLSPLPAWYDTLDGRRASGIRLEMSERQARAAMGVTLIIEHLAHVAAANAITTSLIPIVVNGTTVGSGLIGRECASIDFSHGGDPLDVRHFRMAFSTYQWHRARPDIFGAAVAAHPPLVAIPRRQPSLTNFLHDGRDMPSAAIAAEGTTTVLPNISRGVVAAVDHYRQSPLARFHAEFDCERTSDVAAPLPAVPDDLPPCIVRPLHQPNDLLLKPEYIQNLVRGLLARRWRASQVAALVEREYRRDHGWGDRWRQLDARTRADFDVRVFAGLIVSGADQLVDFNCTSSQEKQVCPFTGCQHDLREDRTRLLDRFKS